MLPFIHELIHLSTSTFLLSEMSGSDYLGITEDRYRDFKGFNFLIPVAYLPTEVKDWKLGQILDVEFSPTVNGTTVKNHVSMRINFAKPHYSEGGKVQHKSVRVDMSVRQSPYRIPSEWSQLACSKVLSEEGNGTHWKRGVFTVKLLPYDSATRDTNACFQFKLKREAMTLREFLNVANKRLDKFFFITPDPEDGNDIWKGCYDFVNQYYTQLVMANLLTPKDEKENEKLYKHIPYVYERTGPNEVTPRHEFIRKGAWENYKRIVGPNMGYNPKQAIQPDTEVKVDVEPGDS
ncbi:hypothetical protein BDZ89DRAFT_1136484 [Hymenopellis radicata]|nr:hypothetical protein BDZ89DRAFT_1136484 [Hymenopellis radicata]